MLLAGDIGGTKANLAIYSPDRGVRDPLFEKNLPSRPYDSLEALVADFLGSIDPPDLELAIFAVAGPVVEGEAEVTNLPWLLREEPLSEALAIPRVRLLNDLESIADAVPVLEQKDLHTLHVGDPVAHTPLAVVAPGTGLGEAFLTWDGVRYRAHPSEGGHTSFAPTNDEEMELLRFLSRRYNHVSYERVCSGIGIPNIYTFLKESGRYPEPADLAAAMDGVADITPVIVQNALGAGTAHPICTHTLEIFVSILGAEASNLALTVLATGGVFLGGGIPPRILSVLDDGPFMRGFLDKGRFADLLADIPVHVILNAKAALLGAASFGLGMLQGTVE